MRVGWYLACVLVTTAMTCSCGLAETLTYADLVQRLIDMERLAELPAKGERTAQFSSYNRMSRYDAITDKYLDWDANYDGCWAVREEGNSQVLAEIDGPGCIWRIWSAQPESGHVKIYLDGKLEPVVDLPFSGYFDEKNAPFNYPSLVYEASKGKNCYVPIPFNKSCRVVGEVYWGVFYHIGYSTFPKGTIVPTFTRNLNSSDKLALERIDTYLRQKMGTDPAGRRKGEKTITKNVLLPAGKHITLANLRGPQAITCLNVALSPNHKKDDIDKMLRSVALRIRWDGEEEPSVWSPLGDFFGTAPGVNNYRSLPLGMTDDCFYCYWYMPFATSAVIELDNDGKAQFEARFVLTCAPLSKPAGKYARFHAKWHRDAFLPDDPDRVADWTMLTTVGRGRYCGTSMEVWSDSSEWWGEGDEKMFVDGEKFPSTFGTGMEDYFGYAWCDPEVFCRPFHAQTRRDTVGHACVNRWHISDSIPFQTGFQGYMEKYIPNISRCLFAATTYWYLQHGGKDPYKPVSLKSRSDWYARHTTFKLTDVIEAEKMKILEKTAGNAETRWWGLANFSGDAYLNWYENKPGDRLVLGFAVETAGRYELWGRFVRYLENGIFQLSLDGSTMIEPLNLCDGPWAPPFWSSLGVADFSAGEHRIVVDVLGSSDLQSNKSCTFAMDCIKLEAVK